VPPGSSQNKVIAVHVINNVYDEKAFLLGIFFFLLLLEQGLLVSPEHIRKSLAGSIMLPAMA